MAFPPTVFADIGSVVCLVAVFARWAFLGGIGRINHLHLDPESCSLVDDERGELNLSSETYYLND